MASDSTDERLADLQARATQHGFNDIIEFTVEAVGEGWARATVPHSEQFVNPPTENVMHGGITAATLDATMGYAIMSTLYDDPTAEIGPTINLNVNYVSTASESLVARGELIKLGTYNALVEGQIEGAETEKLVATGQGTWRVFRDRDDQE
jgi:uncharacterized protein (TIGR00369 family)